MRWYFVRGVFHIHNHTPGYRSINMELPSVGRVASTPTRRRARTQNAERLTPGFYRVGGKNCLLPVSCSSESTWVFQTSWDSYIERSVEVLLLLDGQSAHRHRPPWLPRESQSSSLKSIARVPVGRLTIVVSIGTYACYWQRSTVWKLLTPSISCG